MAESVDIAPRRGTGPVLEPLEAAIVAAIRAGSPLSRSELAERLDYSRATITPIAGRLLAGGLLVEVGEGKSAGGRRPYLLDINPAYGYVAGIDIGATSVDVALADFRGAVLERLAEPADVGGSPEPFLGRVAELLAELLARRGANATEVLAIGIGVPGPVDFTAGVLIAPPLMPLWEGFPIRAFMARRFPVARVVIDNDVNIMAKGEQQAGAGRGLDTFLFIKIGTGIGCGIVAHGEVYRGADGCAGDVGHICVDYNGPVCHCGNQGCLEIMAAGPAIAAQGRARAEAGESDFLAARLAERGALSATDVGDAAAAGDRAANEIIRRSGRMVGGVLATLVNFYNPEAILIGGGVSGIGHSLLSSIRQATLRRATALSTRHLRIEYAPLGADAGVIGGIWLGLEKVFAEE